MKTNKFFVIVLLAVNCNAADRSQKELSGRDCSAFFKHSLSKLLSWYSLNLSPSHKPFPGNCLEFSEKELKQRVQKNLEYKKQIERMKLLFGKCSKIRPQEDWARLKTALNDAEKILAQPQQCLIMKQEDLKDQKTFVGLLEESTK